MIQEVITQRQINITVQMSFAVLYCMYLCVCLCEGDEHACACVLSGGREMVPINNPAKSSNTTHAVSHYSTSVSLVTLTVTSLLATVERAAVS